MNMTATFGLLVVATLSIEVAMNLPMGSLPLILDSEHIPQAQIAFVMSCALAIIVLVSLPVGAFVDRIGRIAMMKLGMTGSMVTLVALTFTHGVVPSAILMALRTVAMVSFYTAQAAYVSVLVPEERSVSAVASMGILGNLAFALAPACSVWLWQQGLGREQYLWATLIIGLGGVVIFLLPKERDVKIERGSGKRRFIRASWIPAITLGVGGALQGGVNMSLAVLAFHQRGIANGAAIFSAAALTTVLLRYPGSRLVERFGPRMMALPTAIVQAVGCYLAASANTLSFVVMAGIALGSVWAVLVPTVLALLFENSSAEERGAAMGAYNFTLGLGFTLGAALATVCTVYGAGYSSATSICALALLCVSPCVLFRQSKNTACETDARTHMDDVVIETCPRR